MPLPSQVHVPSTVGEDDKELSYMIEERNGKWCLISKSTGEVIGCHDTREGAENQERAIQANKSNSDGAIRLSVEEMKKICPSCADNMVKKRIKEIKFEGFRTKCMDGTNNVIDDVAAFCNLLKEKCHGSVAARDYDTKKYSIDETHNIKGVEIFSVGEWNGDRYTHKDLEQIAESFTETKKYLRPYLKLGHGEEQNLLRADELPAAGYISDVYKKGEKLYADIERMPKKIFELVRAHAYERLSCELLINVKVNGKRYPIALQAIGLLGGATPAVENLDSIRALYNIEAEVLAYSKDTERRTYEFKNGPNEEDSRMPEKECPQLLEEAKKELEEMKKKVMAYEEDKKKSSEEYSRIKSENENISKELESLNKKYSETNASLEKVESERKLAHAEAKTKELVSSKKILPAQADAFKTLFLYSMDNNVKKFKLGEEDLDAENLLLKFVEKGTESGLSTQESSELGKSTKLDRNDTVAFSRAVQEYADRNKLSFRDAYIKLSVESESVSK